MGKSKTKVPLSARASVHAERYLELFEALSPLVGSRRIDEICTAACEVIATLLEVQACSILLHDPEREGLVLGAATHIAKKDWPSICMPTTTGICSHTFLSGKTLLLRNKRDFQAFGITPDPSYGRASCVVTPLIVDGEVTGIVNIAHPRRSRPFNERDVTLIEAATRLVAGGIQNARRFAERVQIHEQLEEILDNLHVGVVAMDADLDITLSNHVFRDLLGRPQTRIKGKPLREVLDPPLFKVCQRLIEDTATAQSICQERLKAKLGPKIRSLEVTATRASLSSQSMPDCLLMFEDVGQEEELVRLRQADSIKGAFLRMISHELRTPLTVIQGAMPILHDCAQKTNGSADDVLGKVEQVMNTNVQKMIGLVNTILDVVEIENGSLTLAVRLIDLNELIEEKIGMVAQRAKLKKIVWDKILSGESAAILADRQRLGQAIYELLDNAVKFSPLGGKVRVQTAVEKMEAVVRIANQGEPVEKIHRKEVFEKFYQIDGSTTRRTGGCGLGLYLAKYITELHQGSLKIVDDETEDSVVFELRMPLAGHQTTLNHD